MTESDIFPSNPSQWPYGTGQKALAAQIRKNRAALDNVLFFDTILTDEGAKLYPPKNREELHRLHDKIEESETDSLKKSCLYYYLLKDFKVDGKYAMDAGIPEQFCRLISGFYALDHLQFEEAIQCFSYPGVAPGYTDKILGLLLKQSDYPNAAQLAVLFIEATRPPLDSTEKMTLYMNALLHTDFDTAFKYQRTTPDAIRRELFASLVDTAMNSPPPRTNLQRLFSFPLTAVEKELLTDHLQSVKDNGFPRELLLMWDIQSARFSEAKTIIQGDSHVDETRRVIRDGLEKAGVGV